MTNRVLGENRIEGENNLAYASWQPFALAGWVPFERFYVYVQDWQLSFTPDDVEVPVISGGGQM